MSDIKTAIEAMPAKVDSLEQMIGDWGTTLDAKLAELGEKLPKAIVPDEVKTKAELEQAGALEGISRMKVWDIPLGQALVGGFTSVVVSELVDGFLATQSNTIKGVVKLVAAGVAIKWGGRLLGKTGAGALAILLAYDGIRQLLPIDEWAGRVSGAVVSRTGGGLAGKAGMTNIRSNGGGALEAQRVADYYGKALGR